MDTITNSKQMEFLMRIKDVGMKMIFRKVYSGIVVSSFSEFEQYITDDKVRYNFVHSMMKMDEQIKNEQCTPDDLLMEMGQYTLNIIYEDAPQVENPLYNDDEGWFYT